MVDCSGRFPIAVIVCNDGNRPNLCFLFQAVTYAVPDITEAVKMVEWWWILLAILGGLVLLIIIVFILYKVSGPWLATSVTSLISTGLRDLVLQGDVPVYSLLRRPLRRGALQHTLPRSRQFHDVEEYKRLFVGVYNS